MKNAIRKLICFCCAFFMLAAVVQSDEKAKDKELFEKVSAKLDKGGSYFNYQSNKYLFKAIENTYKHLPEAINVIAPEQGRQMMALMVYNALRPLVMQSGLNEMLAGGASSIMIAEESEGKPALFRSRQFIYYGDKDPQGLIWKSIAEKNYTLAGINKLPKETLFASESFARPSELWKQIKRIFPQLPLAPLQGMPINAEQAFMQKFQMSLPELLKSTDGIWSSLLVEGKDENGKTCLYGMLKIPNKDGKVFELFSRMAESQDYLKVEEDKILLTSPTGLDWLKPMVKKAKDCVYIVTSPKAIEIAEKGLDKGESLAVTDEFKYLSQDMPEKGIAFIYFSKKTIEVLIETFKAHSDSEKDWKVLSKLLPPSDIFIVARRENDGIMYIANSPLDIPQLVTYSSVMPSLIQASAMIPGMNKSRKKVRKIRCSNNLKQLGLALKMYAMDHADKYPTANNFEGLNDLIKAKYVKDMKVFVCPFSDKKVATGKVLSQDTCSYIYFGGFVEGEGATIPMVVDKFDNNKKIINVLYQDGHVEAVPNTFGTCLKLVDYLSQINKYSPEILKRLKEKAAEIDKELGYK